MRTRRHSRLAAVLAFFVLAALASGAAYTLAINMPGGRAPTTRDTRNWVTTVGPDGKILFGEGPVRASNSPICTAPCDDP